MNCKSSNLDLTLLPLQWSRFYCHCYFYKKDHTQKQVLVTTTHSVKLTHKLPVCDFWDNNRQFSQQKKHAKKRKTDFSDILIEVYRTVFKGLSKVITTQLWLLNLVIGHKILHQFFPWFEEVAANCQKFWLILFTVLIVFFVWLVRVITLVSVLQQLFENHSKSACVITVLTCL